MISLLFFIIYFQTIMFINPVRYIVCLLRLNSLLTPHKPKSGLDPHVYTFRGAEYEYFTTKVAMPIAIVNSCYGGPFNSLMSTCKCR